MFKSDAEEEFIIFDLHDLGQQSILTCINFCEHFMQKHSLSEKLPKMLTLKYVSVRLFPINTIHRVLVLYIFRNCRCKYRSLITSHRRYLIANNAGAVICALGEWGLWGRGLGVEGVCLGFGSETRRNKLRGAMSGICIF